MRGVLAVLALGGALVGAGCADGGREEAEGGPPGAEQPAQAPAPSTMTREEAIARAEEACARTAQEIDELADRYNLKSPAAQGRVGELRLVIERDLADTLGDLDPPAERLTAFERFVESVEVRADLREQILEKAAAGDRQGAEEAATDLAFAVEDAQEAASEYGLPTCADLGPE